MYCGLSGPARLLAAGKAHLTGTRAAFWRGFFYYWRSSEPDHSVSPQAQDYILLFCGSPLNVVVSRVEPVAEDEKYRS